MELTLKSKEYNVIKNPKYVMILLHGYGSNSDDLISLAPDLGKALLDTIFISPNAPFSFEGGIMGGAYQWYSLLDRSTKALAEGYIKAAPILEEYIESVQKKYKVKPEQVILSGFSQGGMMTLQFGTHYKKKLAALLSFSGYIIGSELLSDDNVDINKETPIFISHGLLDVVVPVNSFHYAVSYLKHEGYKVTSVSSPGLGHGIDLKILEGAKEFLRKNL